MITNIQVGLVMLHSSARIACAQKQAIIARPEHQSIEINARAQFDLSYAARDQSTISLAAPTSAAANMAYWDHQRR